jgi:putative ABC transport system permease protein
MGVGTIVVALASIIIGEVIFTDTLTLPERLITIIIGSIFYRFVLVIVLYIGFNADDLKLVSAIILGLALMLPRLRSKLRLNTFLKRG